MITRRHILMSFCSLTLLLSPRAWGQEYTIKFATLAPEGTTWINVMREYDQAVRAESKGRMGFKIYAGGVQGDEIDVLRKMKLGQLQSAGVTGNGLTTVAPKVRILDSPFLFSSYAQVDTVYRDFDAEFSKAFEENGYVNLGWAEVGFVYVFTNTPVRVPGDLQNVKMWMWEGDPIAEAAFRALDVHPIPLASTDVMTSLQTRLVDGVYSTPYAMLALQWFSRVKYMLDIPLADAAGAVVIVKKKFDELPPDLREILVRNGKKYMQKLTYLSREDNKKAIETLKQNGITVIEPSATQSFSSYAETGKKARRYLVGSLFSAEFLDRVEAVVARQQKSGHAGAK